MISLKSIPIYSAKRTGMDIEISGLERYEDAPSLQYLGEDQEHYVAGSLFMAVSEDRAALYFSDSELSEGEKRISSEEEDVLEVFEQLTGENGDKDGWLERCGWKF